MYGYNSKQFETNDDEWGYGGEEAIKRAKALGLSEFRALKEYNINWNMSHAIRSICGIQLWVNPISRQ